MTQQLENIGWSDYDGTGTDATQIFYEDDPGFVPTPAQTHYARGHFNDSYEAAGK